MAPRTRPSTSLFLLVPLFFGNVCQARQDKLRPPLYTGDFSDCRAGQSSLDITKFDLAYDAGNNTLTFHLDGASNLEDEALLLHISIDGYGTNRLDMTVDPCDFNITGFCPLSLHGAIAARGVFPVGVQPIGELSRFPINLPDYEGSAKLQIYASSNNAELACVQAVVINGKTLSHPEAVAPALGVVTIVAILASFLTAAYGISIPHMRMHHAHSLSVLVVFETFQTIFFSGALSVNWPSILVAWFSNFAWSAGLIYTPGMIKSMNSFAGVTDNSNDLLNDELLHRLFARVATEESPDAVNEIPLFNSSFLEDYTWSGKPVAPGLPPPGTWPGFPATLSAVRIPVADAFMVGLIWFLVAVGLVILAIAGLKASLEGLVRAKKIKQDQLAYFRSHWTGYLGHAMLRTLTIAFFSTMTLTMLQFTIRKTVGPVAVATVVFILIVIGLICMVASGCRARTRDGKFRITADRIVLHRKTVFKKLPSIAVIRASTAKEHGVEMQPIFSIPYFRLRHVNNDTNRPTVHLDEPFVKRFGWLTARYRRTRWWFLAYHITYLFCRAAFLGGGWQSPRVQVYGILVADVLNFALGVFLAPLEGARNTAMGVWTLGICKIITTGISAAFLPGSDIDRSHAAVLGIVIIAIQGLTVTALLILIVLSVISSWLSMMRNREEVDPDWMEPSRVAYFTKMERKARDSPFDEELEPPPPTPRFSLVAVQRRPKIEDEDGDAMHEPEQSLDDSSAEDKQTETETDHGRDRHSRTSSVGPRLSTGSLPRAARPYRVSWSREHGETSLGRSDSVLTGRLSGVTCVVVTDCDTSATPSPTASVKPQSSMWSLTTPSASRASSPSLRRPSREIADGRRPPTALPEAPEPSE